MGKKNTLETSMKELEKIVSKLESGDFGLDESLKKFEDGIKLYKECRKYLSEAEKKIEILSEQIEDV